MKHEILLPQVNTDAIPRGAAVIQGARDKARVYHNPRLSFSECCSRAITHRGAEVELDFPTETVGYFDDQRARVEGRQMRKLQRWIGRRELNSQAEVEARVEETRAEARKLARQGRYAEALIKDRHMGL